MKIETIHDSLVNGQRRQMAEQIDEYGDEFPTDYRDFIIDNHLEIGFFINSMISYFRIKGE